MAVRRSWTLAVTIAGAWLAALVVLAAAAPIAAPAAAQTPPPALSPTPVRPEIVAVVIRDSLTLDQVVQRALSASPAMLQAEGGVTTAGLAERTALGSYLPSLSVSSGASLSSSERFNPQTNTTVTGSSDSYSAGLSASWDVYTGGRRGAELDRSRAELEGRLATRTEQQYAVTRQVKSAFFDALRAAELVGVAEARLRRAEQGLETAQRRLDVGSATRSDVLRSRLELTDALQALAEAHSQRGTAAHVLGRLAGLDHPVAPRAGIETEVRPLALADDELRALIDTGAPAVLAAEASVQVAEATAQVARAQYLPTLRLSSGYDWFNQERSFDDGRTSWGLRLGLSYPLFNGFQREETVQRSQIQASIARATLEDARRAARTNLERVLASLRLAEQRIALTTEAVEVAEEDLRVQEERYRLGATTILERLTSQASLAQAELNLVAARYDYQLARAELEALAGRDL
jgi:outer membrane protein